MKLTLVTVSALAVFTVDGWDLRNEPLTTTDEVQFSPEGTGRLFEQNLPDGSNIQAFDDQYQIVGENGDFVQHFERTDPAKQGNHMKLTTTDKVQFSPEGTGRLFEPNLLGGSYIKASDDQYQHIEENGDFVNDLERSDPAIEDNHMKEEKIQHERKSNETNCKAKTVCVLLGGFCVTNATLCNGRLVSQGCKGPNCQCCIQDSIKPKLDSLKGSVNNLNTNMNSKVDSLKSDMKIMSSSLESIKSDVKSAVKNKGYKTHPIGKYWPRSQCPFSKSGFTRDKSLADCTNNCTIMNDCTAFHYHSTGRWCEHVNCPVPAPRPTHYHDAILVSYSLDL